MGEGDLRPVAVRWNGKKWMVQRTPSPGGAQGDFLLGVTCPHSSACTAFGFSHGSGTPLTMTQRWNGRHWRVERARNPVGAAESALSGVACPTRWACMAVGTGAGATLSERWNGMKWQKEPIPTLPGAFLNAVSCPSRSACFAVGGSNAGVLAEQWNGMKWTIQHSPTPAGETMSGLGGVSCTSPSFCMAAGAYSTSSSPSGPVRPLTERWNGKRWMILPTPNPAGAVQTFLGGTSCTSPSACTTTGEQHFKNGVVHTVAERWNGSSWHVQPTPNPPKVGFASLAGVACTGPTTCIAAGASDQGTLAERWNGKRWTILPTPNPPAGGQLTGVACSGAAACTAVGYTISFSAIGTSLGGKILAERWNGTRWRIQPTPVLPVAHDISTPAVACPARTTCTAVGGYENDGPGSVTLAERWHGGSNSQPAAPHSSNTNAHLTCIRPLAAETLVREALTGTPISAPTRPSLTATDPWQTLTLPSCAAK
jgi:hypothetical protein